jgi:hypothetical protein
MDARPVLITKRRSSRMASRFEMGAGFDLIAAHRDRTSFDCVTTPVSTAIRP